MKKTVLLTTCCAIALNLYAQRTTNELPYGLLTGYQRQTQEMIVLDAPDKGRIEKEDTENDQKSGPVRFAYPVHVNFTPENSGVWQQSDDGGKVWRLKVILPGALATYTLYDKFWLPKGAKFFVYSEETKQSYGAFISDFIDGSKDKPVQFSTGLIFGESVVYEYYQPASVKESPVIFISRIDYGYRYVSSPFNIGLRALDPCNININCPEGDNWQAEKHAVCQLLILTPNGGGLGSGALINNTNYDFTPYVLTANHNLLKLDANGNNDASLWQFYWEYEYPGCENSTTPPILHYSQGATVVANNKESDFALLKINANEDPRYISEVTPYYLGWDRSGNAGTGGVGIHHPSGNVKRLILSNLIQNDNSYTFWDFFSNEPSKPGTHWEVSIYAGGIQRGSSGSPFINNNRKVIGQLHGGGECAPISAGYGKFSVSWNGMNIHQDSIKRRLDYWLAPGMSNPPQTLDGTFVKPSISGPTLLCRDGGSFMVTDPPAGYTWGKSSNLNIVSTGNNTISVAPADPNYTQGSPGWVSININGVEKARKDVWIGYPDVSIDGPDYVSSSGNFTAVYNPLSNPTFYWGATSGSYTVSNYGDHATFYFNSGGAYQLYLNACNNCGCDVTKYKNVQVYPTYRSPLVVSYPNPVSDILNIKIDEEAVDRLKQTMSGKQLANTDPVLDIRLYDQFGRQVRSTTAKNGIVQFNVSDLPNGIYFLRVYDGISDEPETQTIIVKH